MSIALILDKSVFQSLNFDEIVLLHNYYKPNVTPILVKELMADLKKDYQEGNNSEARVIDFARKLLPYDTNVNSHYLDLITGDLVGKKVEMDYRPILGNSSLRETHDGQKGFYISQSEEEIALARWRDGDFLEAERKLASIWREVSTKKDLLENLKDVLKNQYNSQLKFSSLDELNSYVTKLMDNPSSQGYLLLFALQEFGVDQITAGEIFLRYEQASHKDLKTFAPYAYYCTRLKIFFYIALRHNLIGTRSTNILDLDYLYYLPFCLIMSSSDKFQQAIIPYFISDFQTFVKGDELKKDLKTLVEYRSTLFERKDIERTKKKPPLILSSFTFQAWNKYYVDWQTEKPEPSNAEKENAIKKIREFMDAKKSGSLDSDYVDPDFLIKETYIRLGDPCLCGSGKKFMDCCLTPEQFVSLTSQSKS